MEKVIAPPPLDTDFTIIYNQTEIKVSKFKLLIASDWFQKNYGFNEEKTLNIVGKTPTPIFIDFIETVQNHNVDEVKKNMLMIFLKLSEKWNVDFIREKCIKLIETDSDIQSVIENIQKEDECENNDEFISILAPHLDFIVSLPSFPLFPLDTIYKLLSHPKSILRDHHKLFNALINLLSIHGSKAANLVNFIDLSALSIEEIKTLLNNDIIKDKFLIQKDANELLHENFVLKRELNETRSIIQNILQRLQNIETVASKNSEEINSMMQTVINQNAEIKAMLIGNEKSI